MKSSRFRAVCMSMVLTLTTAAATMTKVSAVAPGYSSGVYIPITTEDVRKVALTELKNATAAGRLSQAESARFGNELESASSMGGVEHTWAELEARAQQAKSKHVSLDNLLTTFLNKLDSWQKQNIVTADQIKWYRDRVAGIRRIQKQITAKDHFFDFWEFCTLAIDYSSLDEKINRALASHEPPLETIDQLLMRTDNYIARNEVCARMLTVYKSFEVEPDNVRDARETMYMVLKDRSNSRWATPEVRQSLYSRLQGIQYEACKVQPTEDQVDTAIVEVQRLLDSGARNGNLSAFDDVRLQHELELVKELKKAYPGPNPGIDPIERELRAEEMRFASLDLRFLQDWLGRVLRKDGEAVESREVIYRLVRRIDLAYFSHRITHDDMVSLLSAVNTMMHDAKNDGQVLAMCRDIEGRMDMMVSDFSMVPAKTGLRLRELTNLIAQMNTGRDPAVAEKERIQQLTAGMDQMSAPQRYGASIVASAEAEMLRDRVRGLLRFDGTTPKAAGQMQPTDANAPKRY